MPASGDLVDVLPDLPPEEAQKCSRRCPFHAVPFWGVKVAQGTIKPWQSPEEALLMFNRAAQKAHFFSISHARGEDNFTYIPMGGAFAQLRHSCVPNAAYAICGDDLLRVISLRNIELGEEIRIRSSPSLGHDSYDDSCKCGLSEAQRWEFWKQENVVASGHAVYASHPLPGVAVELCSVSPDLNGKRAKVIGRKGDQVDVDIGEGVGRRMCKPQCLCRPSRASTHNPRSRPVGGLNTRVDTPYDPRVLRELQLLEFGNLCVGQGVGGDRGLLKIVERCPVSTSEPESASAAQRLRWLEKWSAQLELLPTTNERWSVFSGDVPGGNTVLTVYGKGRKGIQTPWGSRVMKDSACLMSLILQNEASSDDVASVLRSVAAAPAAGEPRMPARVTLDFALRGLHSHVLDKCRGLPFEVALETKVHAEDRVVGCPTDARSGCFFKPSRSCANPGCTAVGKSSCAKCRAVHYCSKTCQTAHWATHKKECGKNVSSAASFLNEGSAVVAVALECATELNGLWGKVVNQEQVRLLSG